MGLKFKNKVKSIAASFAEEVTQRVHEAGRHKGRTVAGLAVFVVVLAFFCASVLVYAKGHSYYEQSNYVEDSEAKQQAAEQTEASQKEEEPIDPELLAIQENIERYRSEANIITEEGVYNILLIGVDRTKTTEQANSDSMILVSVNHERKQISMVSLMRDTYVHIPGIGYRKLNAAYANGGGPLLVETVTENYMIQVDRYMAVSFKDMIDIINTIGTVRLNFTEAEAAAANQLIERMCGNLGMAEEAAALALPGAGSYDCNGIQAVAYARIRKVGNADYQRTERQREVLEKLSRKIRMMRLTDIDKLANQLLPLVTHNIPENEFWGLLGKVPSMIHYQIVQDRIPYDGMFQSRHEYLVPDWEATLVKLREMLYGAEE